MGRSNKFENTLIDEKAMNDFILLRTELPGNAYYFILPHLLTFFKRFLSIKLEIDSE